MAKAKNNPPLLARVNAMYGRGLAIATVALVVALAGYVVVTHSRASSGLAVTVSGNHLVDAQGRTIRLIGVNQFGHCSTGVVLHNDMNQAEVNQLKKWNINVVRIIMNEDCWLGIKGMPGGGLSAASLHSQILAYISLLNQNGIYVIFDLHTNAPNGDCPLTGGTCVANGQQVMADEDHAITYWADVANTFKSNPAVILEPYNEPHVTTADANTTDPWACWRDGCQATEYNYSYTGPKVPMNWQIAGMQQLVDTIRSAGAHNVLTLGGLGFSNNLSKMLDSDPAGKPYLPNDPDHQLAATFHSYKGWGCSDASCWDSQVLPVAQHMPVLTDEMGQSDCGYDYVGGYMDWADQHGVSYMAWTWVPGKCDPGLTSADAGQWGVLDADGVTPNSYGQPILTHFQQVDGCPLIKANFVNTCRPWTGAAAKGNPGAASDYVPQFGYLEQLLGQPLDIFRDYHSAPASGNSLDTVPADPATTEGQAEIQLANAGTVININWVPSYTWLESMPVAQGGSQATNQQIAQAAQNIKAIAPHKVFLSPWHEGNILVSDPGTTGSSCSLATSATRQGGTPAQFVAAWQNVHDIFASSGVTNVIWDLSFSSYHAKACWVQYMWPGNNNVDWVTYDTYSQNTTFQLDDGNDFYNLLASLNNPAMATNSKPWGIGEFGDCDAATPQQAYTYFDSVTSAVNSGAYPKLKMYQIYADSGGPQAGPGCLTNYDPDNTVDPTKQSHINTMFQAITQSTSQTNTPSPSSPPPSPSTPPPTPKIVGDINGDGLVNICDMSALLSAWGTTNPAANLDGKGTVDIIDLSILISNWTGGSSPAC